MNNGYDGLVVIRIPVTNSDIFTASIKCMQNVMNIMPVDVCVSETEGLSYCSDYTAGYKRFEEWVLPNEGSAEDEVFC